MAEGAAGIFSSISGNADAGDFYRERARLHAKIGQLTVELDWLTKKSKQLGLRGSESSRWIKNIPKSA
jgi:hypothetical protein